MNVVTDTSKLFEAAPHRNFGQSLIGETWEREL